MELRFAMASELANKANDQLGPSVILQFDPPKPH